MLHAWFVADTRSAARTALTCLAHPASLLALAVLALNDHVLKAAIPSPLTGKLSDVAGLFFFPFLLTALVAWHPRLRRFDPLRVGRWLFGFVAVWFAAAKTLPVVHALTVDLATVLFGPVRVVRDPSDALAILAVLPAWWLYRRALQRPVPAWSRVAQAPAICVALVLTAATSDVPNPQLRDVISHDGALHVLLEQSNHLWRSVDGKTWMFEKNTLPKSVVDNHRRQYRLKVGGDETLRLDKHSVWSTRDGTSWHKVWGISAARREFMRATGSRWDWQAYDMVQLPRDPRVIVIALGNQGVLVRNADGGWSRHAVGGARPTPARASLADTVKHLVAGQWLLGLGAAMVAWALLSWLTWCTPRGRVPSARAIAGGGFGRRARNYLLAPWRALAQTENRWNFFGAVFGGLLCGGLLIAIFSRPYVRLDFLLLWMAGLTLLAFDLIAMSGGWWLFRKRNPARSAANRGLRVEEALLCGVLALLPMALWDLAVIETYLTAFVASMVLLVVSVLFFFGRFYRRSKTS